MAHHYHNFAPFDNISLILPHHAGNGGNHSGNHNGNGNNAGGGMVYDTAVLNEMLANHHHHHHHHQSAGIGYDAITEAMAQNPSVFYCAESPLDIDQGYYSSGHNSNYSSVFDPTDIMAEEVVVVDSVPSEPVEHVVDNVQTFFQQHQQQQLKQSRQHQQMLQQQQQQLQQQQPSRHHQQQQQQQQQPPQQSQHYHRNDHQQTHQQQHQQHQQQQRRKNNSSSTTASSSGRPSYIHIPSSNFEDHLPAAVPLDYGAVMDSVCREQEALGGLRRARVDRTIFDDDRVLANLLKNEQKYMPSSHYFKTLQPDLKPFMRKMVTDWMLEVCEEQQCEDDVFSLAVNYLDRFLSQVTVQKQHLQLVAAVAMFVASKLKESQPLTADKLVLYTDNSITYEQMLTWELLLLGRLRWDVASVTPHDFFDQILWRLRGIPKRLVTKIRRHAQHFANLTATDFKFIHYPPSMIAACCISAAIAGLNDEAGLAAAQSAASAAFFAAAAVAAASSSSSSSSASSSSSRNPFHPLNNGVLGASSSSSSASSSSSPFLPEFNFDLIDLELIFDQLQRITDIDAECLRQCHEQIEVLVCANSDGANGDGANGGSGAPAGSGATGADDVKNGNHGGQRSEGALTTPTDVEAVAMMISAQ